MSKPRIVVIACEGLTSNLLVESLSTYSDVVGVFIEQRESKALILKRRLKKIGAFNIMGQLLFLIIALPIIPKRKKRISEILNNNDLKGNTKFDSISIKSTQEKGLITSIIELKPDLIVINGTRILKKSFIEKCPSNIVNIHVGITPKYRGIHGGYWAIYNNDSANFGVTLHFVDAGIDTGNIIAQKRLKPTSDDNYKTYPILQFCEGLSLLKRDFNAILSENLKEIKNIPPESRLYYNPTLGQYLFGKAK